MTINLVSGPRNVSTALMYSFAQRSDTEVVDEPFYAVYLTRSGADHPGAEAVLTSLSSDEGQVRARLSAPRTKAVLFIKNMAHHMEVLNQPFLPGAVNLFLIRDPLHILLSYSAVKPDVTMRDIGVADQYRLFELLRTEGETPLVVDASALVSQPEAILAKVCLASGLPFEQRMVHWPAGPKPYDGIWAPFWYGNVHQSTGFERRVHVQRDLPAHLRNLCAKAREIYDKLRAFSLKA